MSSTTPRIDPDRADRFVSGAGDYLLRLPAGEPIGQSLKALREARGVTQTELAKALGLEQTHVSRIETRDDPKLSTLLSFLQALAATGAELQVSFNDGARITIELPDST